MKRLLLVKALHFVPTLDEAMLALLEAQVFVIVAQRSGGLRDQMAGHHVVFVLGGLLA